MVKQLKSNCIKIYILFWLSVILDISIWSCSDNGVIQSHEVEAAMNQVDRKHYCQHNPYMDAPQGIGYGATISAPHMVT